MKKKRLFKSCLSCVLVIVFIIQLLPVQVFSVDLENKQVVSHDYEVVETEPIEFVELRDAYTKHFRSPEGECYAEVYAQPMHYKQNGEWKDYDLSLQLSETAEDYTVSGTDTPISLPQSFAAGEKVTVSRGAYSIGFGVSVSNTRFNTRSVARLDANKEDASADAVRYKNILPDTDLTYTVLPNGVKENIIVKQEQDTYHYVFDMDFGGLLPMQQDDGSVFFMETRDDEKPVFVMDAPYMFDAAGNLSREVTLTLHGNRLTLEADETWLNAEDRVFPVTIDPYCYVPSQSRYIHSGYVTNLHKNNNYVGKISTGRNGLYADRTYLKFDFPDVPDGCEFTKATLVLYQNMGIHTSNTPNYIRLYDLSDYDEWAYNTVTWNNQPVSQTFGSYVGTPYVASCTLSDAENTVYTFNITSLAEDYYDEIENNGYLLAMQREDSGEFAWMGEVGGGMGTPPELRVYYVRPCQGCGDQCTFDTSTGESCPCTCASWEVCNCPECGHYCDCGKLNCAYGVDCLCSCPSAAECTCVACKGVTTTVKDNDGNITSYSVTDGTKTMTETYTYNAQNSMTSMVDANGNSVYYTYDSSGEKIASIAMGNSTVNYTMNSDDLLTAVSQNVTGLTNGSMIANSYTYNTDKNVTSITHNGFAYNFTYDANGNNTEVDVGSSPLAEYTYDANGNLTQIEYGNMDRLLYSYDSENRLQYVFAVSSIETSQLFQFAYDNEGILNTVWDYAAGTRTEYVSDGYDVYSGNTLLQEVHFCNEEDDGYNGVYFSGQWGYADTEELDSEFDFETGETTYAKNIYTAACSMVSELVYDYFGRKTGSTTESEYDDGNTTGYVTVTESVGYNDTATTAGTLPTTYTSTVAAGNTETTRAFRYTYDGKGNITAVYDTTTTPETLTARYTYDEANQLVREDNAQMNKTVTYAYDKGGNIVTKTEYPYTLGAPGTATDTIGYTYDSTWKDLLTEYDGMELYADAIGNPQEYTHDREFIWIGRDLIYISEVGQDDFVECRYNENGLRSFKCLYDGNDPAATYHYFWSDDNRLLGYVLDDGDANTDNVQMSVLYDTDNAPIGFTVNDHTYYYLKNIQGDVLCVTDETGTPLANYVYDAWGNFTLSPASQSVSNQDLAYISAYNPVTYRGYLYDPELGFYYLQSRYYDPETCRFLNADSTDYCSTEYYLTASNLYAYCLNEPIRYKDLTGHGTISELLALQHLSYNSKINVSGIYINGQALGNVGKMKYGIWKIAKNGCELIAIYNTLLRFGKGKDLAHIIFEFEMNGVWMDGLAGTKLSAVGGYLKRNGFKLKTYYKASSVDNNTSKGDVCVLAYRHTIIMIHTVMTIKTSDSGNNIDVYNRYSNSNQVYNLPSAQELIARDGASMIICWRVAK